MFAILAERELGPKLYGIFPQGRLEQYVPVSPRAELHLHIRFPSTDRIDRNQVRSKHYDPDAGALSI